MMMMMITIFITGKARNSKTLLIYWPQTCLRPKKKQMLVDTPGLQVCFFILVSVFETQPVVVSTVGIFYQTASFFCDCCSMQQVYGLDSLMGFFLRIILPSNFWGPLAPFQKYRSYTDRTGKLTYSGIRPQTVYFSWGVSVGVGVLGVGVCVFCYHCFFRGGQSPSGTRHVVSI